MKYSLLYVEDDRALAALNIDYFSLKGFNVIHAPTGEAAIEKFKEYHPDIVLLDIVLPGIDGYEVARKIRNLDNRIPVLFLTSLSHTKEAVKGFSTGANDYIRKDTDIEEITARLFCALRFTTKNPGNIAVTDNTFIDVANKELVSSGRRIKLSFREYDLLSFLVANSNMLHSRAFIASNIWGGMINGDIYLRKSLSFLRKALSEDPKVQIETHRGDGVVLVR